MAKKRDRKGGRQKSKGDAPTDGRGLRRHLRRLEKLLAEAAKKESRRVRKLGKAHIRRQRIETEIDAARISATTAPAVADRAGKPVPASSSGAPAPGAERAKKTPAGAATKAARSKAAPARTARAKAAPAKSGAAKSAAAVEADKHAPPAGPIPPAES